MHASLSDIIADVTANPIDAVGGFGSVEGLSLAKEIFLVVGHSTPLRGAE